MLPVSPSSALSLTLLLVASGALAHHGSTAAPTGLLAVQQAQVKRSTLGLTTRADRVRNRTTQGTQVLTEAFGQYRFSKRFAAGLAVPWLHTRPEDGQSEWGLGNLGASLKAGYASGPLHTGVGVLELRLPTQSVQLGADPGEVWALQVLSVNSWTFGRFSLMAAPGLASDHRPAGTGLDARIAGFVEYAIGAGFLPALGIDTRVRLGTWCRPPAGTSAFCAEGRASDVHGRLLSPLASVVPSLSFRGVENTTISASIALPVLPREIGGFSSELAAIVSF